MLLAAVVINYLAIVFLARYSTMSFRLCMFSLNFNFKGSLFIHLCVYILITTGWVTLSFCNLN